MKQILSASIAIALLGVSCASAATPTTTWSGAAGDGLWNTAGNWATGAVPSAADYTYISTNSAVTVDSGVNAQALTLSVGSRTSALMGTSSLTINGGSLNASSMIYLAATGATNTEALNATISLVNGASLSTPIFSIGRGVGSAPTNVNYVGWLNIDKTSSASVTTQLELGRRYGTGHLTLEGDATSGAILTVGFLNASITASDGYGTAYITLGTNSRLTAASSSLGVNTTVVNNGGTLQLATNITGTTTISTGSITANGGTVSMTNGFVGTSSNLVLTDSTLSGGSTFTLTGSNVTATNSTVSIVGASTLTSANLITTNSTVSLAAATTLNASTLSAAGGRVTLSGAVLATGSNISLTNASASAAATTLTNSTLDATGSSLTFSDTLTATGSTISLTNATVQAASTWAVTSSTIAANHSLLNFSNLTVAASTVSLTNHSTLSGNNLTISGSIPWSVMDSTISLLGNFRLANTGIVFNATNSIFSVGGTISGYGTNKFADSTLTASAWYSDSSGTLTTFTNSTISIQSGTALSANLAATNAFTTLSGSTFSISQYGQASTGRLTLSNSLVDVTQGGRLVVGTTLSMFGSTLNINASTVSVGVGTSLAIYLDATSQINLANGAAFLSNISSVTAGTLSLAGTVSISGGSTLSTPNSMSLLGNAKMDVVDSYVLLGGGLSQAEDVTISTAKTVLNLTNSTLVLGGQLLQVNTNGNNWVNSTVSAAAWGGRYSSAATTLSNTVVTLSAATAQTINYSDSTAFAYLTNGSHLYLGENGSLCMGRLSVLDNSTFSMTGGTAAFAATLTVSGPGAYASITGGSIAMNSTQRTTAIQLRNGGVLSVSGTGVITGAAVANIYAGSTFSGALYVGTLPGSLPTSYVSTQTLSAQSGAHFLGSINVAADGNVKLSLSGAASSLAAISAQNVSFDSAAVVTVDFANLTLSGDAQLTLLLADTLSGLNLASIVTQNLDSAYQVTYSEQTIGAQTALIASLTTIPEPAVAAVLMGLLGLVAVARRRR